MTLPLEGLDVSSVADLYRDVDQALRRAFPWDAPIWVRGEIQSISDRTGHCYVDLVDPDGERDRDAPVLKVKCWKSTWTKVKVLLETEGLRLEQGSVVTFRGRIELYQPRGEIGFVVDTVDVEALVGRQAARRAALLRRLRDEGLLPRNSRLAPPELPLRIGLVASVGTEGCKDFLGQIESSGFGFDVIVANAVVQGPGAPGLLAASLNALSRHDRDLLVVVRGGGSKADLASFDSEELATAIALCSLPVWTGIGHSGDESIADLVAQRSFITPTACGQEVVHCVEKWWGSVTRAVHTVSTRSAECLAEASERDSRARRRLVTCTRSQLDRHRQRLVVGSRSLKLRAPQVTSSVHGDMRQRAARLAVSSSLLLTRLDDQVLSLRRLLGAYDLDRQLERGYTITLGPDGKTARSAAGLFLGDEITTRFVDGSIRSKIESRPSQHAPDAGPDADAVRAEERR